VVGSGEEIDVNKRPSALPGAWRSEMIMRATPVAIWRSQCPTYWLDQKIQGRDNRFDQIRLGLALIFVLGHSWYLAAGPDAHVPFATLTVQGFHQYAVYLFFFISGLLVTESARRREGNLLGFVLARVDRIFPGLIVCALLTPPLLMAVGA
jgi:peptidoglycan/LPS O-acetylase OafA/YrhL